MKRLTPFAVATHPTSMRGLVGLSFSCIVGFGVIVVVLHRLRPDVEPGAIAISQYALGSTAFVMTLALWLLSCGSLALAVALARYDALWMRWRFGVVCLFVWSGGVLISGVFHLDPFAGPKTLRGIIHDSGATVALLALLAAQFRAYRQFATHSFWRPLARPSLIIALLGALTFCLSGIPGYFGLFERVVIAIEIVWLLLLDLVVVVRWQRGADS